MSKEQSTDILLKIILWILIAYCIRCLFVCSTLYVSLFIHKIVCRNMNKSRSRFTVNGCVPFSFEPPAKEYAHMLSAFHSKCDFISIICLPFLFLCLELENIISTRALVWEINNVSERQTQISFENVFDFSTIASVGSGQCTVHIRSLWLSHTFFLLINYQQMVYRFSGENEIPNVPSHILTLHAECVFFVDKHKKININRIVKFSGHWQYLDVWLHSIFKHQ